jgi:hypothetical protein
MKISSPIDSNWHEVSGTTMAEIAKELGLEKTTGWSFKVNGNVRKSLGTVNNDDVVEMIEDSDTSDNQTLQPESLSTTNSDNG